MSKTFVWVGPKYGLWQAPGNWNDVTDAVDPSLIAPGSLDNVSFNISSPSQVDQLLGGTGSAANLTLNCPISIIGTINVTGSVSASSLLDVSQDGTLTAEQASLGNAGAGGTLIASDGGLFSAVNLSFVSYNNSGSLYAGGDCIIRVGTLSAYSGLGVTALYGGTVEVTGTLVSLSASGAVNSEIMTDSTSVIDIGGTSGAAGALTVENGGTLITQGNSFGAAESPSLVGNVVDNGLIQAGVYLTFGSLSPQGDPPSYSLAGAGTLEVLSQGSVYVADTVAAGALTMQVDDSGFLSLESVAANAGVITLGNNAELLLTATVGPGNTITLGGTDDVLTLGEGSISSLPTFGMTVNGFGTSDMLVVNGPSITSASYMVDNAGSTGTLVLKNGTTAVATLALAGNYSADSFVANSVNATQTQIIVLPAVTGSAGTIGVATQPNATVSLSQIIQNSYYTDNGTIDTLTVTGSGTLQATGNATIANIIVGDSTSGNFSLAGGTISTDPVTINVGGTLSGYGVITGNEAVSGVIIALGGTLEITGAISGNGTLHVGAGAALQLDQADSGAGILFDQPGNGTLILGAPADAGATITGFAAGATIDSGITGASSSLVTTANSATLTLSSGNTTLGSLVFAGTYTGANDPVYNDLTGAITACFAAGTHIATPSGEVAVENLKAGDVVTTLAGPAPVRWIGYRNVRLPPAEFAILQSAEGFAPISQEARIAQMPIRIGRDAIAPDVPHRDLLVSPEHAIHIDGVLVPARHLVNGASITRVITMARVQYFHIELDRHGLLISEGLASESWLDTGNRAAFENADARVVPHPAMAARTAEAAWANDAAAPLVTSGAVLARIREDLIATARANGLLTDDPDLRIAMGGVDIRPLRAEGTRLTFAIPPGARDIVIRSRAACAREVLVDSADVRRLGVSLTSIRLVSARGERWIGLADPMLRNGFHACEGPSDTPFRWTDGNAVLPPALLAGFEEGFTLTLEVAGTLPYPSRADAQAVCDGRGRRSTQAE